VSEHNSFDPDWVVAPAETLREWLEEHNLTPEVLAVACGGKAHETTSMAHIKAVLSREPMSELTAMIIAIGTQTSWRMWLAMEHNYRAGLARGLKDTPVDELRMTGEERDSG
jgi:plasmid maintenance system antidote protein VapI